MIRFPLFLCLLAWSAVTALAQSTLVLNPPAGVAAKGKHVVLLSGDEEYRGEEALPMLAKILSQRHGFKSTVLFPLDPDGTINPDNQKSLPGSEALDSADVIVMSLRFRNWPDEDMKRFAAAMQRGVPIIGLRTSTHAFNFPANSAWAKYSHNSKADWIGGFGKHVLGETWVTHWGRHKVEATRGVIEPGAANDPLLRGVTDLFGNSDVYEAYPPADAKILARGLVLKGMNPTDAPADYKKRRATDRQEQSINEPAMPVVWTRTFPSESGKDIRILTTTMGAATDLENESLRRLVVNGVYWATGLVVPAKADVAYVDPYTPRMYGFRGYRYKLKPSDYALGKTVPEGEPMPPPPARQPRASANEAAPAGQRQPGAAAPLDAMAATAAPAAPAPSTTAPTTTPSGSGAPNSAGALNLQPGEQIALIGNALADRMQHFGSLETLLHAQFPQHNLVVRNLGFSGDEVATRARSKDVATPDEWLTKVGADVIFAFFGYNESFAGREGVAKFTEDLDKFVRDARAKNYGGSGAPRIVLFSPIATEKHPDPNFAYSETRQQNLALYTAAMADLARDRSDVVFVDLFSMSQEMFAEAAKAGEPLTINGVHLNAKGDAMLAARIHTKLFGGNPPPLTSLAELQAAVNAKSEMWHSRYRTVDAYNIYGDRSRIAYVSHPDAPRVTNAQIMSEEMAQRDVLTTNLERRVWAIASGSTNPPAMLPLPVVSSFGTNKPGPNPDSTYPFLSGEEAIEKMTLAPGLKVNLFASEKEFPELAKAVQMNWDTKGRLWVTVWPSYPELTPTAKIKDKVLILEDTDKDGRADTCTTWLDGLNCPTGFQFFKDGILLMQAPDFWFVRDTDGDGKADWKERVLMGLDSADSHHSANSLVYEPGGAIIMSDGTFHRTQVETVDGVVRNIDGAMYRFEPLTGKFETYVAYNFANPHGRAFDYWGNDLLTDATSNSTYFGPAFSGKLDYPEKHPRLKQFWERPSRPSAGSTILTSKHFPDEYWGNFLNPNVIGFQGIFRVKVDRDGAGLKGTRQPDIVQSKDPNFRPVDTSTGPDGALYVIDWHNPLIGHLQSHLRDSNRDHEHGRIYRITAEGRPLAWQPKIDGEPIPTLVKLLERKENHIRTLAKIELGKHEAAKVVAAVKNWVAGLDRNDPDYAHHVLEALWVHQWHNVVNLELLAQVARSPEPAARAAAARVISYWRDRVPNALATLLTLANDDDSQVRLHAVRAASFFPVVAATDIPLAALKKPVEYYLDYVIGETLRQLRPQWRKSLGEGAAIAGGDPAGVRYLLRTLSVADILSMPRTPEITENIVSRAGISDAVRAEALVALGQARRQSGAAVLLAMLERPGELDYPGLGRLLLAQKPEDLRAQRATLLKMARNDADEHRAYLWAALALADNSFEKLWPEAADSPLALGGLLGGIHRIPNVDLRATAYERVMEILAKPINEIPGPDNVVTNIQRDAIRAAVSMRREPEAVLATLANLITQGREVPTAAQGIKALPRAIWTPAAAGTVATGLMSWASKTNSPERTSRDYVEVIQVVDELAGLLPAAEAASIRKDLSSMRVNVYVVRSVLEGMRYDTPRIVVPTGRAFEIIFENPDVMPHNLVVVEPNARERVGQAAMALSPEFLDRAGRAWVPESRDVIAATKMLENGQNERLRIRGIATEGVYEYVCTFPGHYIMMYGQLVVTKDVDAFLAANPAPSANPPAPVSPVAAPAAHGAHGTQ